MYVYVCHTDAHILVGSMVWLLLLMLSSGEIELHGKLCSKFVCSARALSDLFSIGWCVGFFTDWINDGASGVGYCAARCVCVSVCVLYWWCLFASCFLMFWVLLWRWFLERKTTHTATHHIAYFLVHSRANSLYFSRSVLYILAISGTSGSSGFGSHSREQIDKRTVI